MMLVRCLVFAFQLLTTDGRIVYSPIYNTVEGCQAEADAWAKQLEVPSRPCFSYNFCYPQ